MIKKQSYPRAALIGNPSDGYFGKTIAFVFSNFRAEVMLEESDELILVPNDSDTNQFKSINDFSERIGKRGYYGGMRLIKASIKKFFEYTRKHKLDLHQRNFTIRYHSTIPIQLGLAGSSAIITACLKALLAFYKIEIPKPQFANLILSVETEELGIPAGLQDRVAQAYEQPVFMDFDEQYMKENSFGKYETFSAKLLTNLFIAFKRTASEGSEVVHNNLRQRFEQGDMKVLGAMKEFSSLTDQVFDFLKNSNKGNLHDLINANFDLRSSICAIHPAQKQMIELARAEGGSAKFTGSGGAIIGTYIDEPHFEKLSNHLAQHQMEVIKPEIVSNE